MMIDSRVVKNTVALKGSSESWGVANFGRVFFWGRIGCIALQRWWRAKRRAVRSIHNVNAAKRSRYNGFLAIDCKKARPSRAGHTVFVAGNANAVVNGNRSTWKKGTKSRSSKGFYTATG